MNYMTQEEEDIAKAKELGLNARRKMFCEEYMKDLNARQAYIRAGYSQKGAQTGSYNLFHVPEVQAYLTHLQARVRKSDIAEVDELVGILTDIARFDMMDFFDEDGNLLNVRDMPKRARVALEEIVVEEKVPGMTIKKAQDVDDLMGVPELSIVRTFVKKIKATGRQGAIDKLLKYHGAYKEHNSQKVSYHGVEIKEVDTVVFRDFSEEEDS